MQGNLHGFEYALYSLTSVAIAEVTIHPYFSEALRQYVLCKATHKLFARQGHLLAFATIPIVFVSKCYSA